MIALRGSSQIRQASLSKDLAIRKRAVGVDIADLCEHLFEELDKDGDGTVEFKELLQVTLVGGSDDTFSQMQPSTCAGFLRNLRVLAVCPHLPSAMLVSHCPIVAFCMCRLCFRTRQKTRCHL